MNPNKLNVTLSPVAEAHLSSLLAMIPEADRTVKGIEALATDLSSGGNVTPEVVKEIMVGHAALRAVEKIGNGTYSQFIKRSIAVETGTGTVRLLVRNPIMIVATFGDDLNPGCGVVIQDIVVPVTSQPHMYDHQ
jgi:hypothetical protein